MSDKNNIDENNLDDLLRQSFLDEKSKNVSDSEAEFILKQEYDAKIDSKKEEELLRKLSEGKGRSGNSKWMYISAALLFVSASALFIFRSNTQKNIPSEEQLSENNTPAVNETKSAGTKLNNPPEITTNPIRMLKKKNGQPLLLVQPSSGSVHKESVSHEPPKYIPINIQTIPAAKFPILTDLDKKRFATIKKMMLEKLLRKDKGLYTTVDASKVDYMGRSEVVNAFAMRNMQVTNLEYRTFLIDLLMHDRKEEYSNAVLKEGTWTKYKLDDFSVTYFKDEKYNDFPAVNISVEGALLFCRWLEEEGNDYIKYSSEKIKPFKVRLPYDIEWINCAKVGYAFLPDCEGYNTLYELEEGYVDRSFYKRIAVVKKRNKKVDPVEDLYATNRYGMSEKQIADIYNKAFTFYDASPFDTIYPTRMNRFCEVGHVSEMTYEKRSGNIMVIGCCWKSKEEYQKMLSEFQKENASPFVGFRPVIVFEGMPEYKDPFW